MQLGKTGVISDPFMLKHKSSKEHPERPERLSSIMQMLEEKHLLTHPRVEYLKAVSRVASDQDIRLVHPEKYVEYIKELWPKKYIRPEMTILDSYFNQFSNQAARFSLGGVLESVDNLMTDKWRNGFAAVRPPGHHSGFRHTINGFCVFNNVAVATKYLRAKYQLNRIAVVDWDVHHGDGTQHIFNQDKEFLLLSIHRHDRGRFYPAGDDGHFSNCGKGDGLGCKVNIPLNHVDSKHKYYECQAPGDNEYVYIYNRIIEPILKKFKPEFIFVSCGFDAARHDPLGGFTITPNGYFYLTRRLSEFGVRLLVVLEGGYNLKSISQSACAVLTGLLEETDELPEPVEGVTLKNISRLCSLENVYHEDIDEIINFHQQHWEVLDSPFLRLYTEGIKNNKHKLFGVVEEIESSSSEEEQEQAKPQSKAEKDKAQAEKEREAEITKENEKKAFQIAGGHLEHFRNLSAKNQFIQKKAEKEEIDFYKSEVPERRFAPQFKGMEQNYIVIRNLLYKMENYVVIDVKMSVQLNNPYRDRSKDSEEQIKMDNSTTGKYKFRVTGYATPTLKESGMVLKDEQVVRSILQKAVTHANRHKYCAFLKDLAATLRTVKRRYFMTSIILAKGEAKSQISWVDFHYWYESEDYDVDLVEAFDNLRDFIQTLEIIAEGG